MFEQKRLKNGMKAIYVPVAGTKAVTVLVLCRVGSRYETRKLNGASHFIEHLMFKGTERRPTTLDISQELDSVGAEYNAATSKDWTGYFIKSSSDHLNLSLDMLSDMLWHSKFSKEEFMREKGVIIEEINMYQDNPLLYLDDLLESVMFPQSTLGWDIAGTREIITKMNHRDLISFRDQFYQPENAVLIVAGNLGRSKALAPKYFAGLESKAKTKPGRFKRFSSFKTGAKPRCKIKYKKTEQVHLGVGFPGFPHEHKDLPALQLINVVLGATMSSRLFIAIREREGLAYYVRSSVDPYEDTGIFSIRAGLDPSRFGRASEILKNEITKLKKDGVTREEFKRAKEFIKGKLQLALEDSASQAEFYGKQALMMKKIKTPDQRLAEINRVKRSDLIRVSRKVFDWRRAGIAIIGPYKKTSDILKHFAK